VSSRLDAALRKLVEAGVPLEDLNPEVLSQDYRDPRFANRPMKPESKPYMGPWGGWLDAVVEKAASAAGWLDERSPQGAALTPTNPLYGGRAKAETAVRMMQPLRGRDFGATGVHEGDMYPGVPKAAGMVVGPAIKIAPDVIKAIKRLVRGGDEVVDFVKQADQLKLPRTTRTKKKKPEPEKPREKTIDKLSRKARQEEALESQGELISRSPKYELEVRELSQKQYDDLIDDGWKHQEILDEHPVIPYSVRREGREILGLEPPSSSFQSRTSPTPKIRRPATELGSHWAEQADVNGFTKAVIGDDPEKIQEFYNILDWKSTHKSGTDLHHLYREIMEFPTHGDPSRIRSINKELLNADPVKVRESLERKGILSRTPEVRRPVTDMGIHFGEMADESGYTKLLTGGDPELTQLFYDTLDWKYMDQPYTAAEAAVLQRGQGRDVHAIYDDIRQFWLNSLDEIDPVTKELTTQQSINFNEAVNEKNAKEASNWLIDQAKLFEVYGESLDDLLG